MPGYLFYYHRQTPTIKLPNLHEILNNSGDHSIITYERVTDFGIVPFLFVEGMPANPHYDLVSKVREHLKKQNVEPEKIKVITYPRDELYQYSQSRIPWHYIGPKLVRQKINIEQINKRVDKITLDKAEVVFLESSKTGKELLGHLTEKDVDAVEMLKFLLDRTAQKLKMDVPIKDYDLLYDMLYDVYEYYIWYGVRSEIDNFHTLIENFYRYYLLNKLPKVVGLYWLDTYYDPSSLVTQIQL
jgi:hypothetical protein